MAELHPPGSTTVEFELEPKDGGTQVRLRHSGLTDRGVEMHGEGWAQFLPALAEAAAA